MVIFGVTLVLAFRNLKCSSMGWSAGKSSLPVTRRLSGLVWTPWNWMPWSSTTRSQPVSFQKKSKCHQERRNSPSVASCRPTSSCFLMTFLISSSSILLELGGRDLPLLALGARILDGLRCAAGCRPRRRDRGPYCSAWASLLSTWSLVSVNAAASDRRSSRSVTPRWVSSRSGSSASAALSPAKTMRPRSRMMARSVKPRILLRLLLDHDGRHALLANDVAAARRAAPRR